MVRRTQSARSDATSSRLVAAAQQLFGGSGYAATSIDTVAAAAGVTKGAAYHHFRSKPDLFRAVFTLEQEQAAAMLERAAAQQSDAWAALAAGVRTFLERCLDPGFRRIVMMDGPAVLGWETVRGIQSDHTLRVLSAGLRATAPEDSDGGDLDARCRLVFGALCEAGMLLARSEDPARDLPVIAAEADRLLAALTRRPSGPALTRHRPRLTSDPPRQRERAAGRPARPPAAAESEG
ncbi:TetR/AcrR family transcriptional regulator [Streptomyces sp. ACA25]|uniref:TetR/AcrR family transcriptional regulator n=1 Tax=Streptomyces sp. ACA25 TaxID=3022596 RepID=UPI002307C60F|nr:TetR/AcrR family transcriptional regulator [Streptomyces sp. ACA25]MDB1089052.1 TetR/AcrR family transcriptional regulator [Streptomyces sp. ACA25]